MPKIKQKIALFLSGLMILSSTNIPVFATETSNTEYVSLDEMIEEIDLSDNYADITIDLDDMSVQVDNQDSSLQEALDIKAKEENKILESKETVLEYFDGNTYEVTQTNDTITIKNHYQEQRIILLDSSLKDDYNATKIAVSNEAYLLEFNSIEETKNAYEKMKNDYGEDKVFLDQIIKCEDEVVSPQSGSNHTTQIGLDSLKEQVNNYDGYKNKVVIGILDSGINPNVPFVKDKINKEKCKSYISETDVDTGTNPEWMDYRGHGTQVSYIIAEATPDNVEIVMYKVFAKSTDSSFAILLAAYIQASQDGCDILNCSLSGTGVITYCDAILERLYNEDTIVICSSGNYKSTTEEELRNSENHYPGNSKYTVAVGSINTSKNAETGKYPISSFSCYGSNVDFTAFGSGIVTYDYDGSQSVVSGTSFSAPLQSAEFAYLKTFNNRISVDENVEIMKTFLSSDFNNDYEANSNYHDDYYGYGYCDFTDITLCECNQDDCNVLWHGSYEKEKEEKDTCTITFNMTQYSLTAPAPVTYEKGEEVTELPEIYGSSVWVDSYNKVYQVPFTISKDMVLYPVFTTTNTYDLIVKIPVLDTEFKTTMKQGTVIDSNALYEQYKDQLNLENYYYMGVFDVYNRKVDTFAMLENTTMYMNYEPAEMTVNLYVDNELYEENSINYKDMIDLPVLPNTSTSKFIGWEDSEGNVYNGQYEVLKDVELYAKYISTIETVTITYDAQGGVCYKTSDAVEKINNYGNISTIPVSSKEGYTFKGWYTSPTGGTKLSTRSKIASDVTVYARYKVMKYPIIYVLNDGINNVLNPNNFAYSKIVELKDAQRKGYYFNGWYDNASFAGTPITTINENKSQVLYAKWTKVTCQMPKIQSRTSTEAGKIAITYSASAKAQKYEIQCSKTEDFATIDKTITVSDTTGILSSLESGTKYYIRVRAKVKDSSGSFVCSDWSAIKSITVQ